MTRTRMRGRIHSRHSPVAPRSSKRVTTCIRSHSKRDLIIAMWLDGTTWTIRTTPIYIGQEIKLYPPPGENVSRSSTATSTPSTTTSGSSNYTPAYSSNNPTDWVWPAQGKIISEYSTQKRKNGIEIAGQSERLYRFRPTAGWFTPELDSLVLDGSSSSSIVSNISAYTRITPGSL